MPTSEKKSTGTRRKKLTIRNKRKDLAQEKQLEHFVKEGSFTNVLGGSAWATSSEEIVPLDKILLPDFQLRVYYDRNKIEQIKATILSLGIREPVLLRPHPIKRESGFYELVAGSQRRLSAEELGIKEIPAKVDDVDDLTALKIGLIENDARADFNPYEKARGIVRLIETGLQLDTDEVIQILTQMFNYHQRNSDNNVIISDIDSDFITTVFEEMGVNWQSFVTNQLPLLRLPDEVLKYLEKGQIEYTKAIKISRVKDEQFRQELLKRTVSEQLTLSQIANLVRDKKSSTSVNNETMLRQRVRTALSKATSPKMLKNPKIKKKVERIASQLEILLQEAEAS